MVLPPLQIVAQQEVKDLGGAFHILGHHPDETAGLGVHGGQPHHVRLVLAQALGAVDLVFLPLQFLDDVVLLLVGIGKPGLLTAVDLKKRRLRDIDIPLPDEGGRQAVQHGQHQGADLEALYSTAGY